MSNKTTVINCHRSSDHDIYVGRGGPWGNPFEIGVAGTRSEVIDKYRKWIVTQPHLMRALPKLKGKVLGCWCKPKACHGDVLAEMADKL